MKTTPLHSIPTIHSPPPVRLTHTKVRFLFLLTSMLLGMVLCGSPSTVFADNKNINDLSITGYIEGSLLVDDAVSGQLIDAHTDNGIVTLSGSVDNLLARDQAVRIAESTKGVRSVINEILVTPVIRSDEVIKDDIKKALTFDPVTKDLKIRVQVKNGVVTLAGTVDSWATKRVAAQAAERVKGVKQIANQIAIEYGIRDSDKDIKDEIEQYFNMDPYLDEALLTVTVKNGTAILKGTVGSAAEKTIAYNDAWMAGVTFVDDSGVQVGSWMREKLQRKEKVAIKSDQEIKKAINDAFRHDPRVSPFAIDTAVAFGTVTLCGVVDNLKAKRAAEQDARNTLGVWRVKSHLKVRPVNAPSDSEIAQNIREALSWDPIVELDDIKIKVRNEKVYLDGTVNSYFERQYAEDLVSRIPGVVDIKNNLIVLHAPPTVKSDWEIKKDIEHNLLLNPFVESDNITVSVEDGVATLTGTVNSWQEVNAAVESGFKGGARIVRSRLKMGGVPGNYFFEYDYPHYYIGTFPYYFEFYPHPIA